MKHFLVLVLSLLIIPSAPLVHHPTTNILSQGFIQVESGNPTLYIPGNLTINNSNLQILCHYNLIFTGMELHHFIFASNASISHENISSISGNLSVCNLYSGLSLTISDSYLHYNGTMTMFNSSIHFYYSSLKGTIFTKFSNDSFESVNSTFRVVHPLQDKKEFYISSIHQNGQPISSSRFFPYTYSGSTLPVMPITMVQTCMNYTKNPGSSLLLLNFSMGNRFKFNESIFLNNTAGIYLLNTSLPAPWYDGGFTEGEKIQVNYTMDNQSELTLWSSKFNFFSNSSLNISGLRHNFMVFSHSRIFAENSTFSGNSGNWEINGFINSSRTGLLLENESKIILMDSGFQGVSTSSTGNLSPIMTWKNSTVEVWKSPLIESIANSKYFRDENLGFSGIGNNYSSTLKSANKYLGKFTLGGINSGSVLVLFENNSSSYEYNIFKFNLYGKTNYISLSTGSLFQSAFPTENITLKNASFIKMSTFTKNIEGNFSIIMNMESIGGNSTDINVKYSIEYSGRTYIGNFSRGKLPEEKNASFLFNISRIPDLSNSIIFINSTVTFNNSYFVQEMNLSNFVPLSPYFYSYRLWENGITPGKKWTVGFDGSTYSSYGNCIEINSTEGFACITPYSTGYFIPGDKLLKIFPGNTSINYTHLMGNFTIICTSSIKYNLSVDDISIIHAEGNYTITLPYGNYTIFLNSGRIDKKIEIWINASNMVIYAGIYSPNLVKSDLFMYLAVVLVMISIIMAVCRKFFISFCPDCMELKRPFGLQIHHCTARKKDHESSIL